MDGLGYITDVNRFIKFVLQVSIVNYIWILYLRP